MFNQPTTYRTNKILTSRPTLKKNHKDPETSTNITNAFYKHALSLRKVFGIPQTPLNNLENAFNTNSQQENKSDETRTKHTNLPLLKCKLDNTRKEAYSPYFLNKVESVKCSQVFMHSGSYDALKSTRRPTGAYSTKAKFSKEQTESIKIKCLPSLRKSKINLVTSDEIDLLTGW